MTGLIQLKEIHAVRLQENLHSGYLFRIGYNPRTSSDNVVVSSEAHHIDPTTTHAHMRV